MQYIKSSFPTYYDPARDMVLIEQSWSDTPTVEAYTCPRDRLVASNDDAYMPTIYDAGVIALGRYKNNDEFKEDFDSLKKRITFLDVDLCYRDIHKRDLQKHPLYNAESPFNSSRALFKSEIRALHAQVEADYNLAPVLFHLLSNKPYEQKKAWYQNSYKSTGWPAADCTILDESVAFYCPINNHIVYLKRPTRETVIHELAHAVTHARYKERNPDAHGPLFVRTYLEMARKYHGGNLVDEFQRNVQSQDLDADIFLRAYDVKIDPVFGMRAEKGAIKLANPLSFLSGL